MAQIRPFCGLRPLPEFAKDIASLPYDVYDGEEVKKELQKNPLSFLSVTRSEATMSDCISTTSPAVYKMAQQNLLHYISQKQMQQDSAPRYYIYRQRMDKYIQIGLVACASLDEYRRNVIKKHELTRTDKEQDRVEHIKATNAQTGPVFLTYKNKGDINAYILKLMSEKEPVYDFIAEDGVHNSLFVVDQLLEIAEITRLFADVPAMYIADGHHRCAAARRVADEMKSYPGLKDEEYDQVMAVIFPDNMTHIMPYNRIVKDLNGMDNDAFLAKVTEKFTIEPAAREPEPKEKHSFGMYLSGRWYSLKAKEGSFAKDIISSLDVSILQDNLLGPILGIKNPRTDERIDFVGGVRGINALTAKVDDGKAAVAFAMYPTDIAEVMAVADEGKIMPPKSTWFEPKLRDGLVVHMLTEELTLF
jgi:uncharacterized protein (DUF1015 family)